mgnify:CR=1 FL=1
MRILFLNHNLAEHGNFFRALKFAAFLADKGRDVTLVTSSHRWYRSDQYKRGKVQVIESPSWTPFVGNDEGWSPLGLLFRVWMLMKCRYDVIYGFSHKPVDFIPAFLSKLFRRSFYITDWCDWYGKGGMFSHRAKMRKKDPNMSRFIDSVFRFMEWAETHLEEAAPRKADMVTVICTSLYERARKIGVPEKRLLHAVSGADTVNIQPGNKKEARKILGIDFEETEPPVIFGYIANYHPDEKLLLKAFARVCEKKQNVKMLVAGPDFYLDESEINNMGLTVHYPAKSSASPEKSRIIHLGRVPFKQISTCLAACDALLLPMTDIVFNRGRWPNKFGDYLAAGRPVVTNRVGDIPDILEKADCGYVSQPEPGDFADKMLKMADESQNWVRFGENARKAAENILNWNSIGNMFYQKFESLFPEIDNNLSKGER